MMKRSYMMVAALTWILLSLLLVFALQPSLVVKPLRTFEVEYSGEYVICTAQVSSNDGYDRWFTGGLTSHE